MAYDNPGRDSDDINCDHSIYAISKRRIINDNGNTKLLAGITPNSDVASMLDTSQMCS